MLLSAAVLFCLAAHAQEPATTLPTHDASAVPPADKSSTPEDKNKQSQSSATSNDRLFYALPNFLSLEDTNVPRLTPKEKFKVVARGSFDYMEIPWYAALAGIAQAEDSEPGYGQGAEGYGKRFGAYAADGTIENFMTGAVLPSILHQDPRYFVMGKGSFKRRMWYAVTRIVVTRSDSGHTQFNASEVVGSAISSAISTYSYHPRDDRNLSNTAGVWGSQIGYDTFTIAIKEFWPDIRRKLGKKRPAADQPGGSTGR